jgi:hypothetical protein
MGAYYLIARSRKDNTFTVLKLQETWYLGKEKGREDIFTRANDLEAIDLVTTRFGSESEMAERMAMHGYIPDSNVDIFIASKREKDGKSYIRFDEVLYNRNENRNAAIRRLAQTSLVSDFRDDSYDLGCIYDEVISLAYSADDYLEMLLDGDMNVPKSFTEQLRTIKGQTDIPFDLKDSASFGAKDYATVRNIIESINRLESLGCTSREDRYVLNGEFIEANIGKRMALVPELAVQLDKDYVEGQLSLFSLLDDEGKKKVVEATAAIAEEEKLYPAKIKVDRNLDKEQKRKEIYRVLRSLPAGTICRERGTDKFKVNLDLFSHYPLALDEAKKVGTYLTGNLPKYFAWYMRDYSMLCAANKDGFTPYSEIAEMQKDVEYDIRRIDNRFKSSKCLNMAYEWCMVMEGAIKRDKAVAEGAKVVTDTDDKAKTYGKK